MPYHISNPNYSNSFLKDFFIADLAIKNNASSCPVDAFLFPYIFFNNQNKKSCAFFFSERAQDAQVIFFTNSSRGTINRVSTNWDKEEEAVKLEGCHFLFRLPFKKKGGNEFMN